MNILEVTAAKKARTEERNNGECHRVGCEEREHNGERERSKQKAAYTIEEDYRKEDDSSGEGGGKDRQSHLAAAFLCCLFERLTHFKMAKDVLQNNNRVVNEPREGECEAAQHHRVDRLPPSGSG
jgi:hypothetical protein